MATTKSFTDLSQSKVLAEILPLESADMYIYKNIFFGALSCFNGTTQVGEYVKLTDKENKAYPCWSLAALLSVLEHPRCFQGDKPTYWFCGCFGKDKLYHEVEADNPVDACVAMIEKLHKLKLL